MQRICQICGQGFTSKAPRARYCCPECSWKGAKYRREKWEQLNPGYMKRYNAARKLRIAENNDIK